MYMKENVSTTVEEKVRDHFDDDAERFDAIYDDKKGDYEVIHLDSDYLVVANV